MIVRQKYLDELIAFQDQDLIKVVTGVRRCGKSTLLDMMREHLAAQGVPERRLVTFKMESMEFDGIGDYRDLYQIVRERTEGVERPYLFFDELQNVSGWEKAINSLRVDMDCDIYVTGSNAFLLSSELATLLSGRYVEIRVQPLTFAEYLDFRGATWYPSAHRNADVVTFAANDSLRGPQRAVILCKQDIAEKLEQVVVNTGHVDIKGNTLIALALNFREAATRRYQAYCQQVLKNAQAMEQGIMKAGVETLCGATESHLVLPRLQEGQNAGEMADLFWHGGILVKSDLMPTQHGTREYPILRISSLCPTTRGFHEAEMEKVGHLVGNFLLAGADVQQDVKKEIGRLIMDKPVFSSEWLPEAEPEQNATTREAIETPHKAEASLKHRFMEQILHLGGR